MALIPLNITNQPLGQFDGYDGVTFLGGEVVYLASVPTPNPPGTDLATADVFEDGYTGTTSKTRPAVQLASATGQHPLFLSDDGSSNSNNNGYGTLFGQVVGGTAGQITTGGAVLGPASYVGSGKITLIKPDSYVGVSLDAVDMATDGLVASNASCTVGKALTYTALGKLTPVGSTAAAGGGGATVVAYFEEFMTSGSLVTTPQDLVAALNSPSGSVASVSAKRFTMAALWFIGG
jgi:hypothetical protein